MVHQTRYVLTFLFLCIFGAHSGAFLSAQEANFKLEDFDDNSKSLLKAEVEAQKFVAFAKENKGPEVLTHAYFQDAVMHEYNVGKDAKLTLRTDVHLGTPLLVSKAMQDLLKDTTITDDDALVKAWIKKQKELLPQLSDVLDTRTIEAWTQFLTKWTSDAHSKKDATFRNAMKEASFEVVLVLVETKDDLVREAKGGGPSSSGGKSSATGSASGSAFPLHERRMNHIYHYNDRRMAKAERIRARR